MAQCVCVCVWCVLCVRLIEECKRLKMCVISLPPPLPSNSLHLTTPLAPPPSVQAELKVQQFKARLRTRPFLQLPRSRPVTWRRRRRWRRWQRRRRWRQQRQWRRRSTKQWQQLSLPVAGHWFAIVAVARSQGSQRSPGRRRRQWAWRQRGTLQFHTKDARQGSRCLQEG